MAPPWDRYQIKAEVHRRGWTLTDVALSAGLDSSACRSALIRRHIAGEQALAEFLGVAAKVLWPERYPGRRNSKHGGPRRANQNAAGRVDSGRAA